MLLTFVVFGSRFDIIRVSMLLAPIIFGARFNFFGVELLLASVIFGACFDWSKASAVDWLSNKIRLLFGIHIPFMPSCKRKLALLFSSVSQTKMSAS